MADCGAYFCCCFSGDPPDNDERKEFKETWQVTMMNSCCNEPCCCLSGMLLPCCTQYVMRRKTLEAFNDWPAGYSCCQSYFGCCCCSESCIGSCGKGGACKATCCLCIESWCCCHVAVQATRMYVMDKRKLRSDPCDNRILAFSNCLQCLACICEIAACIVSLLGGPKEVVIASKIFRLIADLVFCCIVGCMTAQANHEVEYHLKSKVPVHVAGGPASIEMAR